MMHKVLSSLRAAKGGVAIQNGGGVERGSVMNHHVITYHVNTKKLDCFAIARNDAECVS